MFSKLSEMAYLNEFKNVYLLEIAAWNRLNNGVYTKLPLAILMDYPKSLPKNSNIYVYKRQKCRSRSFRIFQIIFDLV